MPQRFKDCVVIITGGSTGIGASAAHQFAAEGAHVVLNARGKEALDKVVAEIQEKGGSASCYPADVGDLNACKSLIESTVETYGRLDVLVNNAGVHHRGPITNHDADKFATMVDVNLRAPIVLTRLALPHLMKAPKGSVVNVASLAGRVCLPNAATYSSTKFGMRAFSLALAEELRDTSVSVCAVCPGPVDTGFIMSDIDEVADITFSQTMSTADQVADLVVACALDGKPERVIPKMGGFLTTVAYLFPSLSRILRPMMQRKGARNKKKYKKLYGQD